jgi:inositol-hexakisphosphate/diphosphoinositol-pentakisphosphate 1-kinase
LEKPIEEWPTACDILISFFSKRFPLDKAIKYRQMLGERTFAVQDLSSQKRLWNREAIYKKLESIGVPVPRHIVVHRDSEVKEEMLAAASTASDARVDLPDPEGFVETNDYIEVEDFVSSVPC